MQLLSLVKIYNRLDFPLLKFLIINTLRIFRRRFLVVRLDTNYACNLKCRMCYFSNPNVEKRKPMSLELFKNIADNTIHRKHCIREELAKYADILADSERPTTQRVKLIIISISTNN